jgi:hypothetical protein
MPFFGLCADDPLLKTLVDTFGANALRIPDTRIQPLGLLSYRDGEASWWGDFEDVLTGGKLKLDKDASDSGPVAQLEKTWSRETNWKVGFNILSGFLSAFGVPGGELEAHVKGVTEVAFSFSNVRRKWVKVSDIGKGVEGLKFSRSGAATEIFFGENPYYPLLITDVITSNEFTMDVDRKSSGGAEVDVDAIKTYVGQLKVGVEVKEASKTRITFAGPEELTFAYTCYPLQVENSGKFFIGGSAVIASLRGALLIDEGSNEPMPLQIGDRPGLVELV